MRDVVGRGEGLRRESATVEGWEGTDGKSRKSLISSLELSPPVPGNPGEQQGDSRPRSHPESRGGVVIPEPDSVKRPPFVSPKHFYAVKRDREQLAKK